MALFVALGAGASEREGSRIGVFLFGEGGVCRFEGRRRFYAESVSDLIAEGRKSLAVYLEMCREKGIEPSRKFSGKFNVRLDPGDHAAAAAGKSLNERILGAIREAAESGANGAKLGADPGNKRPGDQLL